MKQEFEPEASRSPEVPGSSMGRLIRSKATKAFLTLDGQWTDQIAMPAHLPNQMMALAAIKKFHLQDIEFYYALHQGKASEHDFTIDVAAPSVADRDHRGDSIRFAATARAPGQK